MRNITVLTLFPEMLEGPLSVSLLGKAREQGLWSLRLVSLRPYGIGRHQSVDDKPFGGGAGMVMRPDVLDAALLDHVPCRDDQKLIYLSPKGRVLTQRLLQEMHEEDKDLVLLCGRYEGVDQRLLDHWNFDEISIGDFVLCGGEVPAMVLIEGYVRLLDGVVGKKVSLEDESFSRDLLEYPQYTHPLVFYDKEVPAVLRSGHHQQIQTWRRQQAEALTEKRRPDLFKKYKNCAIT